MYSGGDLKTWLVTVEHFFEIDGTPDHYMVKIVAMQLDNLALQWYQSFAQNWKSPTPIVDREILTGSQWVQHL